MGKPVAAPTSQSACGACCRPACGKRPQHRQRIAPFTRGHGQGTRCAPAVSERRGFSACPPGVPVFRCGVGRAALDPFCRIPQRGGGVSLFGSHRESSARSSWQSRVREQTPSILRCERWQANNSLSIRLDVHPRQRFPALAAHIARNDIAAKQQTARSRSVLLPPEPEGHHPEQPLPAQQPAALPSVQPLQLTPVPQLILAVEPAPRVP